MPHANVCKYFILQTSRNATTSYKFWFMTHIFANVFTKLLFWTLNNNQLVCITHAAFLTYCIAFPFLQAMILMYMIRNNWSKAFIIQNKITIFIMYRYIVCTKVNIINQRVTVVPVSR